MQRGAREALQTFLAKVLQRCQQGFSVQQVGLVPHTSIKNKFPYVK